MLNYIIIFILNLKNLYQILNHILANSLFQVNVQPVMCRRLGKPSQGTGGGKNAPPHAGGN